MTDLIDPLSLHDRASELWNWDARIALLTAHDAHKAEVERLQAVVEDAERTIHRLALDKADRDGAIAQLDAAHAELAGRLQTAEEQLAAATLEGKP